jgi:phosphoribosyl 1,2-cyclic phosphodiesterase
MAIRKTAVARRSAASTKSTKASRNGSASKAGMTVRFWGVRGSVAVSGPDVVKTGGNTSCTEVRCGDETLIFDMGTGLRPLGAALLVDGPVRASLFLSHYHYDHIAGLPFFAPAYDPRSELAIFGATRKGKDVRQILSGQMVDPYFPIGLGAFNARLRFVPLQDGGIVHVGGVTVRAAELNHPGGAQGFRIEWAGKALVYATDFEHGTAADESLVELARGADLMIFDAQYLPAEYDAVGARSRKGWGHSTYAVGAALARRARVKRLALYHHAPERDDASIAKIAGLAKKALAGAFVAREGMIVEL